MKFMTTLLIVSYGLLILQIILAVAGGTFLFVPINLVGAIFVTYCWFSVRESNRRIKIFEAETARIEAETEAIYESMRRRPRA
jgi:hypothetical protein